ncbi:hypothetical protein [Chimaeribacter arupi]|uniref:hypothetical protein n=1 Tax=Chimaeribacter arupi TaxID=2060066 RepID=UPI000C7A35BE|nr:hypothetical protein [Chimaeribacter arupi]PLR53808.1 hypothetical protein CYR52_04875 [Chimaeribacter arupi]
MKKTLLLLSLPLLSACTVQADFIPEGNRLNNATVGIPYYGKIDIFGGRVFSNDIYGKQVIVGSIHPDNIGLHVQYCDEDKFNNCIQISGVPTKIGVAKVRIRGGIGGGMFSTAGEFDKTYIITINEAKGDS